MDVIGQDRVKEILENKVSHFIILVGQKGQGKETLAKYVSEITDSTFFKLSTPKMEEVRHIIDKSYRLTNKELYYIKGEISKRVENALLKIIEEPPAFAYFVIGTVEVSRLLPTILSRAQVILLSPYTREQLGKVTDNELILKLAENIGHIKQLEQVDVEKLYETGVKIINNINRVSAANVFNIIDHLEDYLERDNLDLVFLVLYHLYEEKGKKGHDVEEELMILNKYQHLIKNRLVKPEKALNSMFLHLR